MKRKSVLMGSSHQSFLYLSEMARYEHKKQGKQTDESLVYSVKVRRCTATVKEGPKGKS